MRLDAYLVEQGLAESRSKAQQLIAQNKVLIAGKAVTKNAYEVSDEQVELLQTHQYVSRAALKLKGFLPFLPFTCKDLDVLDIGSSTGGFTEVLLEEGAKHVDAVDVGTAQLHSKLKADARVASYEQTDIRNFHPKRRYDLVTSDVSFISLHHILDDIERLAKKWIVLLFKPQFEVGRNIKRDKNGVVLDESAIKEAQGAFELACGALGWTLIQQQTASLSGKEGNIETCYCFKK